MALSEPFPPPHSSKLNYKKFAYRAKVTKEVEEP